MSELAGRDVRAADGRYGTIEAAELNPHWFIGSESPPRAWCTVAFEDGTRGERVALGPYGRGDVVLVDRSKAAAELYDSARYMAWMRAYRAGAGLRMAEGLANTLLTRVKLSD